jgi:hypothetical protein
MLSDDNKCETVWQSFDSPANNLLPGMMFGGQQKIISWKSSKDPSPRHFSLQRDLSGAKQIVLKWNNSEQYWMTGTWDDTNFTRMLEIEDKHMFNISVESNSSGLYFMYMLVPNFNVLVRYVMTKFGHGRQYAFVRNGWSMFWSMPRDGCDIYCAYGTHDSRNL